MVLGDAEAGIRLIDVAEERRIARRRQRDAVLVARRPGELERAPRKPLKRRDGCCTSSGGPAGDGALGVVVLEREVVPELVLDDRSADVEVGLVVLRRSGARSCENGRAAVVELRAVLVAGGEGGVVDVDRGVEVQLVAAAVGDEVDDAAERVVLRLHAAGEHLDRAERVEVDVGGEGVGDRVGDVEPVDEIAVHRQVAALDLRIAAAVDVDDAGDLLRDVLVGAAGGDLVRLIGGDDGARLRRVGLGQVPLLDDGVGLDLRRGRATRRCRAARSRPAVRRCGGAPARRRGS